jgi:hypothetical protein
MGRLKIWKNPSRCVVVDRVTLIAESVAVTVAFPTAAPDASRTVPFTVPRVCCAIAGTVLSAKIAQSTTNHPLCLQKKNFITPLSAMGILILSEKRCRKATYLSAYGFFI